MSAISGSWLLIHRAEMEICICGQSAVQYSLYFQHHFGLLHLPREMPIHLAATCCMMVSLSLTLPPVLAHRWPFRAFFFKSKTEQSNELEEAKTLMYTKSFDWLLIRIAFRCMGWMKVLLEKSCDCRANSCELVYILSHVYV